MFDLDFFFTDPDLAKQYYSTHAWSAVTRVIVLFDTAHYLTATGNIFVLGSDEPLHPDLSNPWPYRDLESNSRMVRSYRAALRTIFTERQQLVHDDDEVEKSFRELGAVMKSYRDTVWDNYFEFRRLYPVPDYVAPLNNRFLAVHNAGTSNGDRNIVDFPPRVDRPHIAFPPVADPLYWEGQYNIIHYCASTGARLESVIAQVTDRIALCGEEIRQIKARKDLPTKNPPEQDQHAYRQLFPTLDGRPDAPILGGDARVLRHFVEQGWNVFLGERHDDKLAPSYVSRMLEQTAAWAGNRDKYLLFEAFYPRDQDLLNRFQADPDGVMPEMLEQLRQVSAFADKRPVESVAQALRNAVRFGYKLVAVDYPASTRERRLLESNQAWARNYRHAVPSGAFAVLWGGRGHSDGVTGFDAVIPGRKFITVDMYQAPAIQQETTIHFGDNARDGQFKVLLGQEN